MRTYKLVVVSNRLPISVSKQEGKLHFEASSGGLATAMSTLDSEDRVWVGWPGIASEELTAEDKRAITAELAKHGCYPVYLTKS
jgi:trehalose 6-phosphate synthase/phosphatase